MFRVGDEEREREAVERRWSGGTERYNLFKMKNRCRGARGVINKIKLRPIVQAANKCVRVLMILKPFETV